MADAVPASLVDASDVFEAMGSDASLLAEATPAIESAILRSVVKLQTVLDSSFKPFSNTDMFRLDKMQPAPVDGMLRCRLKHGLVREDTPVTVQWALEADGDFEDVTGFVVNYTKGFVMVPEWAPEGRFSSLSFYRSQARIRNPIFVKVTYASGLIEQTDEVPDELKQAILCFVPMFMMSTAQSETASPKQMYATMARQKLLSDSADDMLREYMRTLAPHVRPMQHTQTKFQVV